MPKIKILFLLIACFVLSSNAFAWDDTGHKITAYIAWQQMTPQARAAAIKILRAAPEDSNLSQFYAGDSRSSAAKQLELFEIAATWADIVRERDFKIRYAKYHHGTWHYLDTFWRDNNGKVELLPEMETAKENAVERLFYFDKFLRDASASNEDKAIALAWIMHLAGDVHQPLHASGRVTDVEPKGDQGGNLFQLAPPDAQNRLNLHWFWDSIIGRVVPRANDACDSDYLPAIAQQIMNKYPASAMQNQLDLGKFDDWQQESFRIASTRLYPPTLIRNQPPSEDYKQMAFDVSEQRLALAGYRLGAMLNQIFDGQTTQVTGEKDEKMKADYANRAKETGSTIGKGANDSWLWTKTRAALMTTADLCGLVINVDVVNSIVTLRGEVSNIAKKTKAEQVAKSIQGVNQVVNELKVSK